jgi:hypothetical protein
MRSIEDLGLVDSLPDDIVVFWRLGDRRRVRQVRTARAQRQRANADPAPAALADGRGAGGA